MNFSWNVTFAKPASQENPNTYETQLFTSDHIIYDIAGCLHNLAAQQDRPFFFYGPRRLVPPKVLIVRANFLQLAPPMTRQTPNRERGNCGKEMSGRQIASSTLFEGVFNMSQICDMGPTVFISFRRKACWGFFRPEKSDGFGRVRTRELGYQRPAC
jgi:hypothetical protein